MAKVGNGIQKKPGAWSFKKGVAETFVKHIRASVPFYDQGHDLVCYLSDYFCHENSLCYELGSSTGQLLMKMATHNAHKQNVAWVGIEIEEEMVKKAEEHCDSLAKNVHLVQEDILLHDYDKADMFVSYYTMQFIPERNRQMMFDKIYERLNWGGAFIMFEKVRGPDARFQDMVTTLYHEFKLRNSFTSEEIMNKATSLKGVLNPFSTKGNLSLFERAGFVDVMTVMKYLCFEGFIAIK